MLSRAELDILVLVERCFSSLTITPSISMPSACRALYHDVNMPSFSTFGNTSPSMQSACSDMHCTTNSRTLLPLSAFFRRSVLYGLDADVAKKSCVCFTFGCGQMSCTVARAESLEPDRGENQEVGSRSECDSSSCQRAN